MEAAPRLSSLYVEPERATRGRRAARARAARRLQDLQLRGVPRRSRCAGSTCGWSHARWSRSSAPRGAGKSTMLSIAARDGRALGRGGAGRRALARPARRGGARRAIGRERGRASSSRRTTSGPRSRARRTSRLALRLAGGRATPSEAAARRWPCFGLEQRAGITRRIASPAASSSASRSRPPPPAGRASCSPMSPRASSTRANEAIVLDTLRELRDTYERVRRRDHPLRARGGRVRPGRRDRATDGRRDEPSQPRCATRSGQTASASRVELRPR